MAKFNFKSVTKGIVSETIPAAVGGAASLALDKVIPDSIEEKLNPKMIAGGKILIGAIIPEVFKKQKMLKPFALGFIGAAAADLTADIVPTLAKTSKVSGIGEVDSIEEEYLFDEAMNGAADDETMSGAEDDAMAGTDEDTY